MIDDLLVQFSTDELERSYGQAPPETPSWRIADDEEFERFLKRFYVDPFVK